MKTENFAKILLIGKTGVGKSSFINYFLGRDVAKTGIGKPITQEITAYEFNDVGYPIEVFDSKGIEAKTANEQKTDVIAEVKKRNNDDNVFNWFHTIFYCVSADKRFEDFEADFIKELRSEISQHIHIILTKCDSVKPDVVGEMNKTIKKKLKDDSIEIFEVVSINKKKINGTIVSQTGKEAIVKQVFNLLLEDIADRISSRYAKELHHGYIDFADETVKQLNALIKKYVKLGTLVEIIKDETEITDKVDNSVEKFTGELEKRIEAIDEKFNEILKPVAELYFSYRGNVSDSFVQDAELCFENAMDLVNTDWWDNIEKEGPKKLMPGLIKSGMFDEDGNETNIDPNLGNVVKAIGGGVSDLWLLDVRLKKFVKDGYDAFVQSLPSEEEIQKNAYDKIVAAMS